MATRLWLSRIAMFVAGLATPLAASARWESSLNLNPRLDATFAHPQGDAPNGTKARSDWAQRLFLKTQAMVKNDWFSFNTEAFFERDLAQADLEPLGSPDLRKSRAYAALQEAYVDARWSSVFLRVGRQPVRWSQSWTLPSLDRFTGRRWNRLFVDPVPEQLTHPDGVLLSYASSEIEAEIFQVVQTAENMFPQPIANTDRMTESQTGVRVKARLKGVDVQLVLHNRPDETFVGNALSYAFDCCVLRAEAGMSHDERGFVIAGFDYFGTFAESIGGEINFGPQLTWYQDPLVTGKDVEAVAYVPIRLAWGKNAIELQGYRNLKVDEDYAALLLSRELGEVAKTSFKASLYAQNYDGPVGRLFGMYRELTDGPLYGVRLDLNTAF